MFILISPKFEFITSLIYLLDLHLAYLLISKAKFCGYLDSGTKQAAHRLKIIFGLLGFKAAELHGNLTQAQRLDVCSVKCFVGNHINNLSRCFLTDCFICRLWKFSENRKWIF